MGYKLIDTPRSKEELQQLFQNTPPYSDILFFDYSGLERNEYLSGIPPFFKFRKEKNNALGNKATYVITDNRGHEFTIVEKNIDARIDAILQQMKILNKVAIKTDKGANPNLPMGIEKHGGIKINRLSQF